MMEATSSSAAVPSKRAMERLQRPYAERTSTIAAKAFFADPDDDWTTLPQRLKSLVDTLEQWVSRYSK